MKKIKHLNEILVFGFAFLLLQCSEDKGKIGECNFHDDVVIELFDNGTWKVKKEPPAAALVVPETKTIYSDKIGDIHPDGGMVFYVDDSGAHGLVCQTEDLAWLTWDEAVKACEDLGQGWRLPTKQELNYMYENLHKKGLGGFTDGSYWSFTAGSDPESAWEQHFAGGFQSSLGKNYIRRVRAVRNF